MIALAEKYMRSADPRYPVGRTRLETVGVVACAVIMTIATIEVIQSAAADLVSGFLHGTPPIWHCPIQRWPLEKGRCLALAAPALKYLRLLGITYAIVWLGRPEGAGWGLSNSRLANLSQKSPPLSIHHPAYQQSRLTKTPASGEG